MTRLLALLLTLAQFSVDAAPRRRAVQPPQPVVAPAAVVAAARQAADAALKTGVPAVQIAVSDRGQIVYSEAFGVIDKQSATAATPRSLLQAGSVTKQFTAAAILRLADRGALTLDDRIEKFVPAFNTRGATITLRQLLSHTSGLRRDWYPAGPPWPNLLAPVTRQQTIQGLNSGQLLDSPPGTQYSYSNAGFMLLGFAIESITGMSYPEFIHKEFALPLGLLDTGVCGTGTLPLPEGYGMLTTTNGTMWIRLPSLDPTVVWSSGSLCTTANDLARWSHMLATGHVLLPDTYATMTTPARLANNTVLWNGYALGVIRQSLQGHPMVWHNGAIDGFRSHLIYLSDQDIAVAVLTNGFPAPPAADPYHIAVAIAKAALAAQ
ncbi:MAG TPA: serine hydrolase domain-containing protein [Thermoanaerobaculia bacterium]